jgi:hypothetical protein
MSTLRKLVACAAVAVVALMAAGGVASAATGTISPGGPFTATSNGRFTFTSGSGNISCNVRLNGELLRSASGTLSATPNPSINPQVGTVRGGSAENCTIFSSATILFPAEPVWRVYNHAISGTRASLYILNAQFDITAFGFVRCLITARTDFTYDSSTARAVVNSITVLRLSAECPEEPGLLGEFTISPRQTFTLTP